MKLSKEDALGILKSRQQLQAGSGFQVQGRVTTVNDYVTNNGKAIKIVNLNLITSYQAGEAKRLFLEGNYDAACNKHLSINLLATSNFIPMNGQDVMCTIGTYENKEGIQVQEVKRINPMPVASTSSFSFDEETVEDTAEETIEEAIAGKK